MARDNKTAGADKPVESPLEAAIRVGVENWLNDHLRNTRFSQDTGAWNVLQEALPHLAPCITKEVK